MSHDKLCNLYYNQKQKNESNVKKTMINICDKMNFYHSICYRLNITNDINNKNDILQSKKRT